MNSIRTISPLLVGVIVAIGCGGGTPENAAATTPAAPEAQAEAPVRVAQAPAEAPPAAGSGAIVGTVRLAGEAPKPAPVKMDADPVCRQQHATPIFSEEVASDAQGMLKNVFVYVKDGVSGSFPPPADPVVLDQSGCWYQPHVFGIQAGQPLEIVNSDPTLHNVNAKPAANQPFNVAQPTKGMKSIKKFAKPEVMVKFKCNVHPWMSAYGGVVAHPFFNVSSADGTFAIKGLPAGTYVIEAWQEKYGTQTQSVTLGEGETKTIEMSFQVQ